MAVPGCGWDETGCWRPGGACVLTTAVAEEIACYKEGGEAEGDEGDADGNADFIACGKAGVMGGGGRGRGGGFGPGGLGC